MKPFENALSGFNHNIKHRGLLFHIQTEDSGKHNPTVTTLLFLGGNILASLKASYAEHLNAEDLPRLVRELMETQHKQMLRNLLRGQYDKGSEGHAQYWQVGQLDEHNAETVKHPALAPSETEENVARPSRPSRPLQAVTAPHSPRPSRPLPEVHRPSRPLPDMAPAPAPAFEEEEVSAVFGEDLISEKRLDELILNYLFREKDKLG